MKQIEKTEDNERIIGEMLKHEINNSLNKKLSKNILEGVIEWA